MLTQVNRARLPGWLISPVSDNAPNVPTVLCQQRYDESRKPKRRPLNRRRIRPVALPSRVVIPGQQPEYHAVGLVDQDVRLT